MLLQKHGCHLGLGTIAQSGCMRKGGVIRVLFVPTHASRVATTRFQSRIRAVESCSDDGDSHTAIGVERQTRAPASVEDHKFTIHGAVSRGLRLRQAPSRHQVWIISVGKFYNTTLTNNNTATHVQTCSRHCCTVRERDTTEHITHATIRIPREEPLPGTFAARFGVRRASHVSRESAPCRFIQVMHTNRTPVLSPLLRQLRRPNDVRSKNAHAAECTKNSGIHEAVICPI